MIIQSTTISGIAVDVDESLALGLEYEENNLGQDELISRESENDSNGIEIEVVETKCKINEEETGTSTNETPDGISSEKISDFENTATSNEDEIFQNDSTTDKVNISENLTYDSDLTESKQTTEERITVADMDFEEHAVTFSESFINNCSIIFEHNKTTSTDEVLSFDDMKTLGSVSTMSTETEISSDVYTTAPEILNVTSLSIADSESSALRFGAKVTLEQKVAALEYGILMCETEELENSNTELTLENTSVSFVRGVAYNRDDGIDNVFSSDDEYVTYVGILTNIPVEKYVAYITARPYIIYDANGTLTYVYGNTHSNSIYRLSKTLLGTGLSEESRTIIEGYILDAENAISLSTADEVYLDERTDRSIGINPDIDIIKFTPEASSFYTLSFSSENDASYEILDEFGNTLPCVESENGSAYLFEKNQTYYVRIKGEPNTEYSFWFNPCFQGAIIYDFADETEGFVCGNGATGNVEEGMLKVSIDKSASFSKAYVQNSNLSIDLFDYSRLIIRMKNTANTTSLSGTVKIDLEYDGSSIDYTLDSSMSANMTEFENIEFDFTTRYGNVSSLKLSFGQILSSLSGNAYIDSIAILPMPKVLNWEFDEDLGGWSCNERVDSTTINNGTLILDTLGGVTGMSPAIISPETSAYDFDKYDVLEIRLKNETTANNMQVYFSTLADGHTSFNENKKFVVDIEPSMTNYTEYTINLYDHALFTDSLKGIMISIPAEGTVSIDYIRLYKNEIHFDDVIWPFDDDLEGFTSNNERHTLSVDNGAMVVETQDAAWGAFFTPDELELPTSEYKYLVLGVKSATTSTNLEAYLKTSTYSSYAENDHNNKIIHKHTLPIEQSNSFKEYAIDLSSVPEGYTTGYTGNLEQFMLALPTPGTYEIDYIKLTNGTTDEEFSTSATKNSEYKLLISKNNNCTVGTYTVKYDADVFELVDACAFTYPLETEAGQAVGTDITITSVTDGTITFTVSNKTIAGAINCLKLKAIKSIDSQITVTTSVT